MWRWTTWREPQPGWTHDHCHFCHSVRFSDRGDGDEAAGWSTNGPAAAPPDEQMPDDYWVCDGCIERMRDRFDWTVAEADGR